MTPLQQQRPDSPPYTTSETNQSLELYQKRFWQRQMARVEEQVSIGEEIGAGASGSMGSSSSGGGGGGGVNAAAAGNKDLMDLFKPQAGQLPLARIKKVMKASDDNVKMISAEAPILFARACEIFIADLTSRSYIHATANRRRTVQRSDVVAAVAGSNLFDFLVDIVPRGYEGGKGGSRKGSTKAGEDEEVEGEGDEEIDEGDERS
ncbi:hypothetical protein CBS101457_003272 [Exobasidium rhododendri]|nr:hypothetical protein CBS101457_003272 [Exobasidium rhododendri]